MMTKILQGRTDWLPMHDQDHIRWYVGPFRDGINRCTYSLKQSDLVHTTIFYTLVSNMF